MRLKVLSLAFCFALSFPSAMAQGQSQLSPQTLELFNEIEHQYFGRNYTTESYDARAQRIEKIMFGDVQAGDPNQRVANIVSFVLQANTDTPDSPSDAVVDTGDEYPHITKLESLILGQTHPTGDIKERLARLETKAFGKSSTNVDLSARTDALDLYVQKTLHQNPFKLNASADADNSQSTTQQTSSAADDDQPDYPHIDTLEKQILGATYIGQPLVDRLSRMEVKAYGKASPNPDLSQRTDDLDTYVENVLHIKSFEQTQERPDDSRTTYQQSQPNSQRKKQIAAFVANSLLGMAGLGFLGVMPPGMSPISRRDDESVSQGSSAPQEDPLITQPNVPPSNTRMITKVGWCEMHTYGHTSQNLHLIDRLTQLNQTLNYAPGQTGMDLMDDMDALIKKVCQRQASAPNVTQ
ncbi:MAG: hypothetical protein K2Y22_00830 [Candidatus Obscuribacterales bacterium]|nr:hypothetical protein [Candidatus Obscuribacterales bacterium]